MICVVAAIHDGDGPIHCANGVAIRIAGIQAPDFESASPCRQHKPGYVCDDAKAEASRLILMHLIYRQTLVCEPLARSHKRVVARCTLADGRDLRCAMIRAGGAVEWPEYRERYGLEPCPR